MSINTIPRLLHETHLTDKLRFELMPWAPPGNATQYNSNITYDDHPNNVINNIGPGKVAAYSQVTARNESAPFQAWGDGEIHVYDYDVRDYANKFNGSTFWAFSFLGQSGWTGKAHYRRCFMQGHPSKPSVPGSGGTINTQFSMFETGRVGGVFTLQDATLLGSAEHVDSKDISYIRNVTTGGWTDNHIKIFSRAVVIAENCSFDAEGDELLQLDGQRDNDSLSNPHKHGRFYYRNCRFWYGGQWHETLPDAAIKDYGREAQASDFNLTKANGVIKIDDNKSVFEFPDGSFSTTIWANDGFASATVATPLWNPGETLKRFYNTVDVQVRTDAADWVDVANVYATQNGEVIGDVVADFPQLITGKHYVRARGDTGTTKSPWSPIMEYQLDGSGDLVPGSVVTDATPPTIDGGSGGGGTGPFTPALALQVQDGNFATTAEEEYSLDTPDNTSTNLTDTPSAGGGGQDQTGYSFTTAGETVEVTGANIANHRTGILIRNASEAVINDFEFNGIDTTSSDLEGDAVLIGGGGTGNFPAGPTIMQRFYLDGEQTPDATKLGRGIHYDRAEGANGDDSTTGYFRRGTIANFSRSCVRAVEHLYLVNVDLENAAQLVEVGPGATAHLIDCNLRLGSGTTYVRLEDATAAVKYWNCRFDGAAEPDLNKCSVTGLSAQAAVPVLATQIAPYSASPIAHGVHALLHPSLKKSWDAVEFQVSTDAGTTWTTVQTIYRGDYRHPLVNSFGDGSYLVRCRFLKSAASGDAPVSLDTLLTDVSTLQSTITTMQAQIAALQSS